MVTRKVRLVMILTLVFLMVTVSFSKTYKIRLLMQDFSPYNEMVVKYASILEEEFQKATGIRIKLDLVPVPSGNYSEKVKLLLASGDIPDIIWFRDNTDLIYSRQGLLEDLRPYVENSKVFQEKMPAWNKERLESYPHLIAIRPLKARIAVVKKEWLDELGIVIPEDRPLGVYEYYDMLKKFTKKADYGMTAAGNLSELDWIFSAAFGVNKMWIKDADGNYVFSKVTPMEKDKLAFYRRLYQDGLLDKEFLTTNWQLKEDKFYSGKVGMIVGTAGIVTDLYQERMKTRGDGSTLIPLIPPIGASGKAGFTAINLSKEPRGFAITTTSKVKDIAFKFLEFMASDRGQYLDRLGIEGIHYVVENGKIVKTGKEWWPWFFEVPSWKSPIPVYGEAGEKAMEIVYKYYEADNYFPMPEEYATKWDEMNNLYKQYSVKIVTGEYSLDKFDEFVEKWCKAGGDLYTKLANEYFKNKEGH